MKYAIYYYKSYFRQNVRNAMHVYNISINELSEFSLIRSKIVAHYQKYKIIDKLVISQIVELIQVMDYNAPVMPGFTHDDVKTMLYLLCTQ